MNLYYVEENDGVFEVKNSVGVVIAVFHTREQALEFLDRKGELEVDEGSDFEDGGRWSGGSF